MLLRKVIGAMECWRKKQYGCRAACSECVEKDTGEAPTAQQSASNDLLSDIANRVSRHLPEGWVLSLNIENGSAWVSLENTNKQYGRFPMLPDAADKTLLEQINDALCVANGFS